LKHYIIIGIIALCTLAFVLGSALAIFVSIVGAASAFYVWSAYASIRLSHREREAEIRNRETDAEFRSVIIPKIGAITYASGSIAFWTKNDRQPDRTAPGLEIPESEPGLEPILPVIMDAPCVLLWGGRGRGKTNLARHVMAQRRESEEVLIIDPKNDAHETWPGFRIAGANYQYQEIIDALTWVNNLGKHKITVFIDEMTMLKMKIPDFSSHWLQPLIEGRSRGQNIWIIGQSKTAGSLGLSGMYDVMASFDFVVGCFLNKTTGERWCLVEEDGEDKKRMAQPGRFVSVTPSHQFQWEKTMQKRHESTCDTVTLLPEGTGQTYAMPEEKPVSQIFESRDEKIICDMWRDGKSLNEIVRTVFKKESNGRYTKQIKSVLSNHGFI
jgi:hypothetical protein